VGAAAAHGTWLLFTDSDCIPTSTFISGYVDGSRGAIAYAGFVKGSPPERLLTKFYDQEGVLLPYFTDKVNGDPAPLYIVTANALVWKLAFDACGGFSELFHEAGGEDVELSVRLWKIGSLECAYGSVVMHDFSDGYRGFWRRFVRYGSGNRVVEATTGIVMRPLHCRPSIPTLYNLCAKQVQYGALRFGYRRSLSRTRGLFALAPHH
jgi:GT2 family glycosyltransferase